MEKQVMLITGASRGIGAATAKRAAAAGYAVGVNYARSKDNALEVVKDIEAMGGQAIAIPGDVRNPLDIEMMFSQTAEQLGPITAVFANAGITGPVSLLKDLSVEDLQDVVQINVVGAFLTAQAAVKHMAKSAGGSGGTIVIMSSRAAQLGSGGEFIHYAASKGAMDTLTIGLAKEVAPEGIRVNAVGPGLIDTDIHNVGDGKRLERLLPGVPMGRIGGPEEVADVVVWLSGPSSSYVTGSIIPISGGR